jgi:hypothetical protein
MYHNDLHNMCAKCDSSLSVDGPELWVQGRPQSQHLHLEYQSQGAINRMCILLARVLVRDVCYSRQW